MNKGSNFQSYKSKAEQSFNQQVESSRPVAQVFFHITLRLNLLDHKIKLSKSGVKYMSVYFSNEAKYTAREAICSSSRRPATSCITLFSSSLLR